MTPHSQEHPHHQAPPAWGNTVLAAGAVLAGLALGKSVKSGLAAGVIAAAGIRALKAHQAGKLTNPTTPPEPSASLLHEEQEEQLQHYEVFLSSIPALTSVDTQPNLPASSGLTNTDIPKSHAITRDEQGWDFCYPMGPLIWEESAEAGSQSPSQGDTVWYQPTEPNALDEWIVIEQRSPHPDEVSQAPALKLETAPPVSTEEIQAEDFLFEMPELPEMQEEEIEIPDADFLLIEPTAKSEPETEPVLYEELAPLMEAEVEEPVEAEPLPAADSAPEPEPAPPAVEAEAVTLEREPLTLEGGLETIAAEEISAVVESNTAEPPHEVEWTREPTAAFNPLVTARAGSQSLVTRTEPVSPAPEPRRQIKGMNAPVGDGFGLHGLSPVFKEPVLSSRGHYTLPEGLPQHPTMPAEALHRSMAPLAPICGGGKRKPWRTTMTVLAVLMAAFFAFAGWWKDGELLQSMKNMKWQQWIPISSAEGSAKSHQLPAQIQQTGQAVLKGAEVLTVR